jgi:predicted component of type VI protein secretion system
MHERQNRGGWRRCGALALLFAAAACSTHTVALRAAVGDGLNPVRNKPDTSAPLNLHAYFLKKTDRFQPEAKGVDAFLGDFGTEPKVPDFLGDDAVRVVRMVVSPTDREAVVNVEEVPKDATNVGLVAFFQWHEENDADEVWSIVVPVRSSTVSFRVSGRKIERIDDAATPEVSKPSASGPSASGPSASEQPSAASSSDSKEAPRGTRRNR